MVHESLLVVSTRGETIGTVIHHEGDETFLVEGGTVFPEDLAFHCEGGACQCEDGALVYTLTAYLDEEADDVPPRVAPPRRARHS